MAKKQPKPPSHAESSPASHDPDGMGLERLVFFSDAVFAIAITLLALEIRLPLVEGEGTNAQLLQDLLSIWPKILGYATSFLVIGIFWLGHHRKFRFIRRYDSNLLILNLFLLMLVGFVPFPTAILSEYGKLTAIVFYAGTMLVLGLLNTAIWWYASHDNRLIDPQFDPSQRRRETVRALSVPAVFAVSIALAFLNTNVAMYSWLLIALILRFL